MYIWVLPLCASAWVFLQTCENRDTLYEPLSFLLTNLSVLLSLTSHTFLCFASLHRSCSHWCHLEKWRLMIDNMLSLVNLRWDAQQVRAFFVGCFANFGKVGLINLSCKLREWKVAALWSFFFLTAFLFDVCVTDIALAYSLLLFSAAYHILLN